MIPYDPIILITGGIGYHNDTTTGHTNAGASAPPTPHSLTMPMMTDMLTLKRCLHCNNRSNSIDFLANNACPHMRHMVVNLFGHTTDVTWHMDTSKGRTAVQFELVKPTCRDIYAAADMQLPHLGVGSSLAC